MERKAKEWKRGGGIGDGREGKGGVGRKGGAEREGERVCAIAVRGMDAPDRCRW